MIRLVFFSASVCLTALFNVSSHANGIFIPGTPDIPLMSGLEIDITDDMNFDTPVGQVLTFEAQSSVLTSHQIASYYRQILPSLGWICQTENISCQRDTDTFVLTPIQTKKPAVVRFEITQTNAQ